MNEEQNVNELVDACFSESGAALGKAIDALDDALADMDLGIQVAVSAYLADHYGDLGELKRGQLEYGEIIHNLIEMIREQTGDETGFEVDFDEGTISLFGDTPIGVIGDSIQSITDRYKALKAGMEVVS